MSGPAEQPVNCAGCRFYQARHHIDHEALSRAATAGVSVVLGHCRRYPVPSATGPEEFCGEHQPRLREPR